MMLGLLWGLACTSTEPKTGDVLLLMVDGVRADKLGAYGYNPSETPHLDQLANEGVKFLRSYAVSTDSTASAASLVTGLAPPQHALRGLKGQNFDLKKSTIEDGFLASMTAQDVSWESVMLMDSASVFPGFEQLSPEHEQTDVWFVNMPNFADGKSHLLSTREYDKALHEYDAALGAILKDWNRYRPEGLVIVSGITGSLHGARDDAAVALTDDLLRVPLIMKGPQVSSEWEVSEVVSSLDVSATMADFLGLKFEGHGTVLRTGGSDVAYHESTYAYGRFSAKPLVGFTNSDGRYSEGVYGQWYPASDSQVYPYTFPSSEYPKEAQTLSELRASFGSDGGLPPDAWRSVLDPLECVSLDSLARKTERAIARGRLDAARRMFSRLQQSAPDAPLVRELERTVNESKQ